MKHKHMVALAMALMISSANAVVITGVPSYTNYHGCSPTSVGMILGYWDLQGYSNLFTASGSDVMLTTNVQGQISSDDHNLRYDSTPDNTTIPISYTSIADYLGTSVDPLGYGASSVATTGAATVAYASSRGYTFTTANKTFSNTWNALVAEVNAGRPMLLFVDSNGDGTVNHTVTAIGYDTNYNGNGQYYFCYNTGHEDEAIVDAYKFQSYVGGGKPFGVYGGITVNPGVIPEPNTAMVLIVTAMGLSFIRHRAVSRTNLKARAFFK
ncbi:MAG: C39 family peptidase [Candidatus Staskawiczbacteria bacterium]|jgi:hypothetical protein